ncbi:MAG: orotidine 5'-phosphate decarboxylase, partial [Phycisphaerae bacterium]|nr:orotidine 5'-phosphate decarboxylase [Phycisphaerae bacterium]
MHYADRLSQAIANRGTPAIVGIDPVLERLPEPLRPEDQTVNTAAAAIESFCRTVIERVAPYVPAVKINSGFFEVFHELGVGAYYRLIAHAHA